MMAEKIIKPIIKIKKTAMYFFIVLMVLLLIHVKEAKAKIYSKTLDKKGRHEISGEIDAYYTWADYTFSLTGDPIPREYFKSEDYIYLHLFRNLLRPRYVLLEASVNPMPFAGVYMKKHEEPVYEDAQFSERFNLIKAVTAGFPEPWALSFFFGNVIDFVVDDPEEESGQRVVGKGFSGFLVSYGHYHIVNNTMVVDNWVESEVKLKGDDIRETHKIGWSYAIGAKWHENPDIRHALYLSIKRSRIDYKIGEMNPFIKFFTRNSEQQLQVDFDMKEVHKGKVTRSLLLFGKKFPLKDGKVTFALSFGLLKVWKRGYRGNLVDEVDDRWSLIIRPNVHFKF